MENERNALLQLKLAFESEPGWQQRAEELASPDALLELLREAVSEVPFFRARLGRAPEGELALRSFPVVRRASYAERLDDFLTPEGRASSLVAWTNGTLGAPLAVRFDATGWYELNYGTYDAIAAAYPDLLSQMRPREDGVFLISNILAYADTSSYVPTLDLAVLRQLVFGRSAAADEALVARLRAARVPLLYGKASTLVALATADQASATAQQRIRPSAILVSGEALYEDQRELLERWFGCPVINAYVATEGGLIALECPHRTGLHVREDRVHVEVLVSGGAIEETGHGELLLTNLMNRGHVFIRYAIGDQVELVRARCPCGFDGKTITALHGREMTQVILPGGPVPTETFTRFLLGLPLEEFQVFQHADEPPWIKWVPAQRSAEAIAAIAQTIDDWLRARGWDDQIASLPLQRITPVGGKHRRCVRAER